MIIRNSARCRLCGDEIESRHRHHFVPCSCGAIFVDDGREYLRYGFKDPAHYEDTSIVEPDPSLPVENSLHSTETTEGT